MEGNPIGVRTTPFGYEAFCSRDGEEVPLGIYNDQGVASQLADLWTVKAALEAGLPLQAGHLERDFSRPPAFSRENLLNPVGCVTAGRGRE